MAKRYSISHVDVFSRSSYKGNPVAVFHEADDLEESMMQQIARWTNLSETVFLLAPTQTEADYRVRIFTPTHELPFAGHPTLGAAHAWLESGGVPRQAGTILQECESGLIAICESGGVLSFAAPPRLRTGPLEESYLGALLDAFEVSREQVIAHQWVDNGPGWAVLQFSTANEVLALDPDLALIPDAMVGAIGAYPPGSSSAFEIRAFAPAINVPEDPVTGSLNASVAQWMAETEQTPDLYTVSQGKKVHRQGEVIITVDQASVWVGGHTTTRFTGIATV